LGAGFISVSSHTDEASTQPASVGCFLLFLVSINHLETTTLARGVGFLMYSARNRPKKIQVYLIFKRFYVDFSRDFMIFWEIAFFFQEILH